MADFPAITLDTDRKLGSVGSLRACGRKMALSPSGSRGADMLPELRLKKLFFVLSCQSAVRLI